MAGNFLIISYLSPFTSAELQMPVEYIYLGAELSMLSRQQLILVSCDLVANLNKEFVLCLFLSDSS